MALSRKKFDGLLVPLILLSGLIAIPAQNQNQIIFPTAKKACSNPAARCLPATACPSAVSGGGQPAACGFNGLMPLICCLDGQTTPTTAAELNLVSAPAINFECGSLGTREGLNITPNGSPRPRVTRAVGGSPVLAHTSWPWVAVIGERQPSGDVTWLCVGSLINPRWVITAYHCFLHSPLNVVRLGEHDYSDPHDGALHLDFEVSETVPHPGHVFPAAIHDIVLLKLARPAPLQDTINPVCLPWGREMERDLTGSELTLTGWGATMFGGEKSPVLQQVNMTLFPPGVCDKNYQELANYHIMYPESINGSFLCMGHPDGGKSACQGDSGGPLVYREGGRYLLAGTVSRGHGCGHQRFPGVHTNLRVREHLQWIKDTAFGGP